MSQNQASSPTDAKPTTAASRILALIPGILLCIAVAGVSALLERGELGMFEHPYVEALVMAILLGMALRSFWKPAPRCSLSLSSCWLCHHAPVRWPNASARDSQ